MGANIGVALQVWIRQHVLVGVRRAGVDPVGQVGGAVGVGVDGDGLVLAQRGERRPHRRGGRGLAHAALAAQHHDRVGAAQMAGHRGVEVAQQLLVGRLAGVDELESAVVEPLSPPTRRRDLAGRIQLRGRDLLAAQFGAAGSAARGDPQSHDGARGPLPGCGSGAGCGRSGQQRATLAAADPVAGRCSAAGPEVGPCAGSLSPAGGGGGDALRGSTSRSASREMN